MKAASGTLDETMVDNADNISGVMTMLLKSGSFVAWLKFVSTPRSTDAIVGRTKKLHIQWV
jgi:hypothetical protein